MKNVAAFALWSGFLLVPCIAQQSTGLNFADPAAYQSIPLASTPLHGVLPIRADLSSNFPRPGNQGQQSSCVGWAVAYALKSYQEHVERKWDVDVEEHRFSPAFIYNQIRSSSDCQGGTSFIDAINLLRVQGVATLADFPYDERVCATIPSEAIRQSARQYAIADWRRVNVQDTVEIKTQIASGFPVLFGMLIDENFQRLGSDEIYERDETIPNGNGHALVVVGYDDNKNAFKIINSWGTGWGDGGFGWMTYSAFSRSVREGYVVQDIVLNPVVPPVVVIPDETPAEILGWAYVGIYDDEEGRWTERYFNIENGEIRPPTVDDTVVVTSPVNLRRDRIRRSNGRWINAAAVATLKPGETYKVIDVANVANGFYWVKIRIHRQAQN
jgi:hypothetical protein